MAGKAAQAELWRRGNLTWKLHQNQKTVLTKIRKLDPKVREIVVLISRRWGKSYLGVIMALMDCLTNDGVQVAIIGPSLTQTKRVIRPIIKKIAAGAPKDLIKEMKSELFWKVGNSTLMIAAFDTALESLRGMELFNVYMEETGQAHPDQYEYTVKSVIFPTLMHSKKVAQGGRIVHLTTPAPQIDHPFHTQTLVRAERLKAKFVMNIHTNPLLTEEEVAEEIENMGGPDSVHTRRELFCEIVRDASITVCPEYNQTFIADFNTPSYPYTPIIAGDFGGVRDKHAFFIMWRDERDNSIKVYDELIYEPQTPTIDIIRDLKAWEAALSYYRPLVRWIDAPGQLRVDLAREPYDYNVILPRKKGLEESVVELRRPFRQRKIWIHSRCVFLQASLRSGRFNHNKTDFERTAEFGHLDAVAALIYGIRHLTFGNNTASPAPPKSPDHYYDPQVARDRGDGIPLDDYFSKN